jgi:hypothetical protein
MAGSKRETLLDSPVLAWRLVGAAVWHLGIITTFVIAASSLIQSPKLLLSPLSLLLTPFTVSGWSQVIIAAAAQSLAFLAEALTLTFSDVVPWPLIRTARRPLVVVAVVTSKLLARLRSVQGAAMVALRLTAYTMSAFLFLQFCGSRTGTYAGGLWGETQWYLGRALSEALLPQVQGVLRLECTFSPLDCMAHITAQVYMRRIQLDGHLLQHPCTALHVTSDVLVSLAAPLLLHGGSPERLAVVLELKCLSGLLILMHVCPRSQEQGRSALPADSAP